MSTVIWQIRLPRGLMVLLVGGILGAVGAVFQALLRNPLADPYILGVSSGAAVGSVIALLGGFGVAYGGTGTLVAGFAGGLAALALVYSLSVRRGVVDVTGLLLAGVTVASLLSAALSFLLLASGHDTNRVLGFLLGHTSDAGWPKVMLLAPVLALGLAFLLPMGKSLNAFAIGDEAAHRLGVDVPWMLRAALLTGTAMTAAAVGAVGIVGFVGLVAPHLARRVVGVDARAVIPVSVVLGMLVMLVADLIAQRGVAWVTGRTGMEVNIGIVCALVGAPSLLILLRRVV